jgi:hypothetical protein
MLPEAMSIDPKVWKRLAKIVEFFGVKSFDYHHTNPKNKKMTRGLRLEFDDINNLHAFELFITILQFFKKENISFSFSSAFNKAVGTKKVQELLAGTLPQADFVNGIYKDLRSFYKRAQRCFLYEPLPQIASWISRKSIRPYINNYFFQN